MAKGIVFNFHNETDAALFEKMIIALKQRYQVVSLEQLEGLLLKKKPLNNICHISFDDGERSFYTVIFPVLTKHHIPVSLFLSPKIITENANFWFQEISDYDNTIMKRIIARKLQISAELLKPYSFQEIFKALPFNQVKYLVETYQTETGCRIKEPQNMNIEQVMEVERSGLVTIGAHTMNHPVLKNEDDNICRTEIGDSISHLQHLLGHSIKYFAYPNGRPGIDFSEREMRQLKDNYISLAFSTELDHLSSDVNMLSVPRMGFPRMGLSPANPLIYLRLAIGKRWVDIRSVSKPSEQKVREMIRSILNKKTIVLSM